MADAITMLKLDEAIACYEHLPAHRRCATLHPAYVASDACRDLALQPLYLRFIADRSVWLHGLHRTRLPHGLGWDASSPYGYGGPSSNSSDPDFLADAWYAYAAWMQSEGTVMEYLRFHPACDNGQGYGGDVIPSRAVVRVDLRAPDWSARYSRRLRQSLVKADAASLGFAACPLADRRNDFAAFYRAGMADIGADGFYQFGDGYFDRLAGVPGAWIGMCYRTGLERFGSAVPWLAACLMLQQGDLCEYHLAASSSEGRALGAAAFVLHHAALHAAQHGAQTLYLGGGTSTAADDPLLFFKSAFSPLRWTYATGSQVFDRAAYARLEQAAVADRASHPGRPIFHRKA